LTETFNLLRISRTNATESQLDDSWKRSLPSAGLKCASRTYYYDIDKNPVFCSDLILIYDVTTMSGALLIAANAGQ
jgi:hypothetical protein